ncbi:MAG: phospholipase D family protein [Burkholderiales bacterium]|nr:phospholipase D family protein [Burkholderiales bacterium]
MNLRLLLLAFAAFVLGGCSTLPPGSDYPRQASKAFSHAETTRMGQQVARAAQAHPGTSGFRILPVGVDGFLTRLEMANAAERSLDLQYFILRADETGQLLADAVLRAADRGVRVRLLLDDGETAVGDEQLATLAAHPRIEIRIFNPFAYRGHRVALRALEFAFNAERLDHRMHNKLFVADNAVALIGGRNVADAYFQVDPDGQFADDDVFVQGPMVTELSASFDEYWNSALAIPVQALGVGAPARVALEDFRRTLTDKRQDLKADGAGYATRAASGEPLAGMLDGRLRVVWAHAQLVCDSPLKEGVDKGWVVGRLMRRPVAVATAAVQSELLMITPYLIPGREGMKLFDDLHRRGVRVRVLTNSLESATVLLAQSGYVKVRRALLDDGVELYELRSKPGSARGSGQSAAMSRFGNYSLHAKLFVMDRTRLFIGSMNFDQRSMHLNTEIGLIIDSPELAQQVAARFDAMVQPANAYALALRPGAAGRRPTLVWRTQEDGRAVEYDVEPSHSPLRRIEVDLLSRLALDAEL